MLNSAEVFGLPPVQSAFVIYGFMFAALVLLGNDCYEPSRMLKTPQFYSVWFMFLSSAIAVLIVAASLIGFHYGGIFALSPAINADYFGNKEVGRNYGWVFTASGVAGIMGPLLAGIFKDAAAGGTSPVGWMTRFLIAGAACLVGAVVMMLTHAPGTDIRLSMQGRGGISGKPAAGET